MQSFQQIQTCWKIRKMQYFIHAIGKFLWWLTPQLFKASIGLMLPPIWNTENIWSWKHKPQVEHINTGNLYPNWIYFSKHHFTLEQKSQNYLRFFKCKRAHNEYKTVCFIAVKLPPDRHHATHQQKKHISRSYFSMQKNQCQGQAFPCRTLRGFTGSFSSRRAITHFHLLIIKSQA